LFDKLVFEEINKIEGVKNQHLLSCVAPWGLFLLLMSGSGQWNFCSYRRSSVGWILCRDNADGAGDCVSTFWLVLMVLSAGFY
jgi:hypothetical protein